jgi:hypothetical protein
MLAIIVLSIRAWGVSFAIMAAGFVTFGFAGPYLPGILEHFDIDMAGFYKLNGIRLTGFWGA